MRNSKPGDKMYRVEAPHYTAGFVVRLNVVIEAAPILQWAKGMSTVSLARYFKHKGYKVKLVRVAH